MLTRALRLPLIVGALLVLAAAGAHAQSPLGIGTAEPAFNTSGFLGGFLSWVNMEQQGFYRTLTDALKGMRDDPWHLWSLVGLSFAYGVFHAAGPGHGKAVISSYMIANETELKRGVTLSFLSSFLQGGVAILLVGAAYLVLRGSSISMTQATTFLERVSYALVAAFGAWLLFRKMRALARATPSSEPRLALAGGLDFGHETGSADDHHHRHAHGHDHHAHAHHAHAHHAHAHAAHAHGPGEVCSSCGHAHAPDPSMLKGDRFQLREAWSAVLAVGLRPCSGALIVLSFALLNGLYLGGVLSVLAMSMGTAITVSILATLAVTAKDLAVRYASSAGTAMRVTNGIEIFGAVLVLGLGLALLGASLQG
ncbi:ABC-type nickel/cobalt efflux system permease component RcnA [Rhizobium sp. PP-F2F-G48]|uniref:nickel/cobalt transporter n=1 Tax=Rhizobium sp. PP-F2F-G48 TaxID=2135651 RepID=UPI001053335E|nr:nickel/cobalt transporter [Rhizobium sp. PP-F2F-G48]TCM53714.1 ABC-type nickel/cobalt efflux system permease component RcnA [Rhizobium sp. PP-F2F-G48]